MKLVVQRARKASVEIFEGEDSSFVSGSIGPGMVILIGIGPDDFEADISYIVNKILTTKFFPSSDPKKLVNIKEFDGEILLVSQFTLYVNLKGTKLDYHGACEPERAQIIYEQVKKELMKQLPGKVQCGIFGADMEVSLTNWGPHTTIIDSRVNAYAEYPNNLSRLGSNLPALEKKYKMAFPVEN